MKVQLTTGSTRVTAESWHEGDRLFFELPFCRPVQAEIKMMSGAKWHGFDKPVPKKVWSIVDCPRNQFQLQYLTGGNPYAAYDSRLDTSMIPLERYHAIKGRMVPLFRHQPVMAAHMLQRHYCIVAGEMGTSKTLSAIIAMEVADARFWKQYGRNAKFYYVAPRSALRAVDREFAIWRAGIKPEFMTYEALTKRIKNWSKGDKAPFGVWFDESSRIKNYTAQRSQAAMQLADGVRADWGDEGYVVLMTGSPAPKSPLDWWSQAEIARPGYLKEGDIYKFKNRLAVIIQKESVESGGVYPELVSWRDDERKCLICGGLESEPVHAAIGNEMEAVVDTGDFKPHPFQKSVNEVAYLQKRLSGLVTVHFKKDCLDLPSKNYRIIELKPSPSVARAAKMLLKTSATTIEGLTRVRELSDGFQYQDVSDGMKPCDVCHATGRVTQYDGSGDTDVCPACKGTKEVVRLKRITKEVPCPKDDALRGLMEEVEDVGRIVVYAGFTGSIDRCVRLCLKEDWMVIRVDGRGEIIYDINGAQVKGIENYLTLFQDQLREHPRVAFVAHPESGGMGITLTAAPMTVYFSNDFKAENRIQSEDRIHRPGMDLNRGASIVDLIHLETDRLILTNLQKKRDLQQLTLEEFNVEEIHVEDRAVA